MRTCIGCGVLEKYDVVGWMRNQWRVYGLEGGAMIYQYLYSMRAFSLAMVVHCTAS